MFSNINCEVLVIDKMALSSSDTQALVGAMDTRVEEVYLYEDVTLDLGKLTQYDGTGKCELLRTWNIKCDNTFWLENQDHGFEDCEKVYKWVGKMEKDWGTWGLGGSIANYIEILRDYEDPWSLLYLEVDENEEDALNSGNEVEEID